MTIVIGKFSAKIIGETCQIEGCKEPARYALYRHKDGAKTWLHVCVEHDRKIGADNMRRYKDGGNSV